MSYEGGWTGTVHKCAFPVLSDAAMHERWKGEHVWRCRCGLMWTVAVRGVRVTVYRWSQFKGTVD